MRAIPSAITGHCCPCGARRHESSKRCRKCSARSRWYRRRAWRTSKTSIRYRIGKSGATGSGKSGGLNELLANLAACADVLIWAIDLKRSVELRTWAPCIDRLATTPDEATALLADAGTIVFARAQHLADHGKREWHPSPAMSSLVIIIDEYAELADDAPRRDESYRHDRPARPRARRDPHRRDPAAHPESHGTGRGALPDEHPHLIPCRRTTRRRPTGGRTATSRCRTPSSPRAGCRPTSGPSASSPDLRGGAGDRVGGAVIPGPFGPVASC